MVQLLIYPSRCVMWLFFGKSAYCQASLVVLMLCIKIYILRFSLFAEEICLLKGSLLEKVMVLFKDRKIKMDTSLI